MRALTSPDNVVDVLLYRLATAVAANHQPHHFGRCVSLRCVGEAYPCPPARDAQRALRAATRAPATARGRAPVTGSVDRPSWGRPTRANQIRSRWPWALPRRQPAASLRAA